MRFWISINDVMVSPVVEELGVIGARLISVKHFDEFYEGQLLGPGSLHLEDIGTVEVSAVVKWKAFPRIGIEFCEMSLSRQDKLFQYLFKVSRQAIRIELSRKEIERSGKTLKS